jgi:hypothetical protein
MEELPLKFKEHRASSSMISCICDFCLFNLLETGERELLLFFAEFNSSPWKGYDSESFLQ